MSALDALSLAERVALTAGRDTWSLPAVEALGAPPLVFADGPHGVRRPAGPSPLDAAAPATCFPTASALAATWDPALVAEVGVALGREARAQGVGVLLGPGANIKRTPLCGRSFEYFSEDPLLSSTVAAAWIRGVQSTGVAAALKHLAVNNQERRRYTVDVLVEERALREVYLASFERAVVEGRPHVVMAAYNRLGGLHCTEHPWLLRDVLRGEWGFDGVVVSDWGAVHDRVASLAAGLDLVMPGPVPADDVLDAVADGRLAEAAVDAAAGRVLTLVERTTVRAPAARTHVPTPPGDPQSVSRLPSAAQPGRPLTITGAETGEHAYDADAHHDLARRVAAEGTVLLKNDGGVLPLRPEARVAVVGAFATAPRYQGAGSSKVTPHRVDDAWSEIVRLADDGRVVHAPGYDRRSGAVDEALLAQARAVAREADVVVAFVGLPEAYETEGVDRTDLRLPRAHDALVEAVAGLGPPVVVVLSNGAPVEMPWVDRVAAVVEAHLGGQAGGSAVARVLYGDLEPGGRLAETFPRRLADTAVAQLPAGHRQVEYREGVHVGYRWYDTVGADVLFPFGHGLAYTTFGYGDLVVSRDSVTVTVTNTGDRAGAEVVQVYVAPLTPLRQRPAQELRGFAKVRLAPGETATVHVPLDDRAFAHWADGGWAVDPGRYEVRVGASSRDVRVTAHVDVGEVPSVESAARPTAAELLDREAFLARYGTPVPQDVPERRGAYTADTPLGDMRESLFVRLLLAAVRRQVRRLEPEVALLAESMLRDMPPRMLPMVSGGKVGRDGVEALVHAANGRRVAWLRATVRAVRRRR